MKTMHANVSVRLKCILRFLVLGMILYSTQSFCRNDNVKAYVIGIEGMPGAGKTTAFINLANKWQDNVFLLSEANPDPTNHEYQNYTPKEKTRYFHNFWIDRMMLIENLIYKKNRSVILDRTYYSNLAYKFAADQYFGTNEYNDYIKLYNKELRKHPISLIILLDVTPEIGLLRRKKIDKLTPEPWGSDIFLRALRFFYKNELSKLTKSPVIIINTDKLSKKQITNKVEKIIGQYIARKEKSNKSDKNHRKKWMHREIIDKFASKHNLEGPSSNLMYFDNVPTVYFQRYSVQVVDGEPIFFDNKRLKIIADLFNRS